MNKNPQDFDDELVEWTDRLLAGNTEDAPEGLGDLADVVRQLKQTIAPDRPPTQAFHDGLQNVLVREWARRPQPKQRRVLVWSQNRVLNLSLLAASFAGVLLVVALLIQEAGNEDSAAQGTSAGSLPWVFGVVAAVILAGCGIVWFFKKRGKT